MNRRLVPLTVLLLFLAAASARADEKASRNAGGKVDMTVRLIYADNQNNPNVDPKLVEILKHDFGYLNYSVKFAESFKLKHDETFTKDLGDNFSFVARYLGALKDRKKIWLELWFRQKKIFGAYTLFCDHAKPLLIKGPNTNEGEYILIVSVPDSDPDKASSSGDASR